MHEFSGFTVNGMRKAIEKLGFAEELLPMLSPEAQATLSKSTLFKFHPGHTMDEVLIVLGKLKGPDAGAAVMEEATRSSIEGVVAPLARMYLTLKGNEPSVLFERFNDLLSATARGITSKWEALGKGEGRLTLTYGAPVDPAVVHGWRGALRYVIKFCGREGEVRPLPPSADGKTVGVSITWSAPS